MKKLDLFILKSFIGPFFAILAITIFILVMQFLWLYIDELVGKGLELKVILEFLLWGSCQVLPLALPLATLLASMMTFGDMGTRRRLSFDHQEMVVRTMKEVYESQKWPGIFTGTSNVWLAMKYGTKCLGTMSHQLISFEENVSGVFECNFNVMRKFSDVYDGDNGIFLYDCFGDKVFFSNLSKRMAMMYKGLRVDSGNEEEQTEKIIAKYKSLGIDPATKQVVYSNGLNIDRAIEIHKYCAGRVQDSYGVGTFLTCDVVNCKPMNIVVKLTRGRITELREWHDCVKLSCDKGKTLGNPDKCAYLQSVIGE